MRTGLRVIVAGSTGFIGRHVTLALRAMARDCSLFGIATTDRQPVSLEGHLSMRLGQGLSHDLGDFIGHADPHIVINCAGMLTTDPRAATRANLWATAQLVEVCTACAPAAFFIQIGSSAEYRPKAFGQRTREDDPAEPVTEYGLSKLQASQMVLHAHAQGRVRGTVLRLFNAVGPGMASATLPGKIAAFMRGHGTELTVGSLAACRDFIDVRDAARAIVCAAVHPAAAAGEIVNIGSGRARPTRELAEGMIARSPRPIQLVEATEGSARSADVAWQEANIEKARRLLGWCPQIPWSATLDRLVAGCDSGPAAPTQDITSARVRQ